MQLQMLLSEPRRRRGEGKGNATDATVTAVTTDATVTAVTTDAVVNGMKHCKSEPFRGAFLPLKLT